MMEDTESQELDVSALNLQPDENVNEPNKFVDSSEATITTKGVNPGGDEGDISPHVLTWGG